MKRVKIGHGIKKHIELVMTNLPYDGQLEDSMKRVKNAKKVKKRKTIST